MANNFISVNRNTVTGGTLISIVSQLSRTIHALQTLKVALDNMTDGVDFTLIESQLGLAPGQGQTIYNLVVGTVSNATTDANTKNLVAFTGVTWL